MLRSSSTFAAALALVGCVREPPPPVVLVVRCGSTAVLQGEIPRGATRSWTLRIADGDQARFLVDEGADDVSHDILDPQGVMSEEEGDWFPVDTGNYLLEVSNIADLKGSRKEAIRFRGRFEVGRAGTKSGQSL